MLPFFSFLRHHLYMVCNSKAGEWTRKQQSQWPDNMSDRFRYGTSVDKIDDFYDSYFCVKFYFILPSFYLPIVSVDGYCCTWLHSLTHTHTHIHTLGRTSLDKGLVRRIDLYLKAHNIRNEQNIHAPGGIRSRNPSKRAAADPRHTQREHWDRPVLS